MDSEKDHLNRVVDGVAGVNPHSSTSKASTSTSSVTQNSTPMSQSLPAPLTLSTVKPPASTSAMSRVLVAVRVRPLLVANSAPERKHESVVEVKDAEGQVFVIPEKSFKFDSVFNEDSSQFNLYRQTVEPIIDRFLTGNSCSIMAYGQTGAGKTFTMGTSAAKINDKEVRGIIPRAIEAVFDRLEAFDIEFSVRVSFFEIYQDKVYDLINRNGMRVPLKISSHDFSITDLTSEIVDGREGALRLLEVGCRTRSTGATAQNASSSRSHAFFRISVTFSKNGRRMEARLNLVDLAGSESFDKSQTNGEQNREGAAINQGLTALSRCFEAIKDRSRHVPFRDSSLTKVLQESFVGQQSCTAMIACISPSETDIHETVNTLRFANAVKSLKKPALPAHLAQANITASAKKRRLDQIAPTPIKRFNATVATPTPTKYALPNFQRRLNSTVGATPLTTSASTFKNPMMSSSFTRSLEMIPDEDSLSDVSTIRSEGGASNMSVSIPTHVLDELKSRLMSPIMRELQELRRVVMETSMCASAVRRSPRIMARATQRRAADGDDTRDADEDQTLRDDDDPTANSTVVDRCGALRSERVAHLRQVETTASPSFRDIEQKENRTPVSARKSRSQAPGLRVRNTNVASTPPLCDLEKALGLNPGSPILFEKPAVPMPSTVKRSVRRTTMLQSDFRASMASAASMASSAAPRSPRRSSRLSVVPSNRGLEQDLTNKEPWMVTNQRQHEATILGLLNTANVAMLKLLPAVGPKTAIIIISHRNLKSKRPGDCVFKCVSDLKNVEGLSKTFFKRFCTRNQLSIDEA